MAFLVFAKTAINTIIINKPLYFCFNDHKAGRASGERCSSNLKPIFKITFSLLFLNYFTRKYTNSIMCRDLIKIIVVVLPARAVRSGQTEESPARGEMGRERLRRDRFPPRIVHFL